MQQLVMLAVVGVGLYAAYRFIRGEINRMTAAAMEPVKVRTRDMGVLVRDPETGVYRPRNPR